MNGRRILLAIGVVAFVVIVTIIIFSVDWGGEKRVRDAINPVNIADYSTTDVRVRMSSRGPNVNNQEHEQMQITVGRDQTVGLLFSGYQGNVTRTEQTGNNPTSYKAFLSALHNAAFTKDKMPQRGLQYDGACPKGTRYTFEFINGGSDAPKSTWATTCGRKEGSFDGDLTVVKNLFNRQLPDPQFDALTNDTQF